MRIDIITLFPDQISHFLAESIVGRAQKKQLVEIHTHNLRDWAEDDYGSVDDHPYGGGPGMVIRVDVVAPAIAKVRTLNPKARVILTTPQGIPYTQKLARTFAKEDGFIVVCGHYEGYDERIRDYVDQEISIGDYVLTGGELPALTIVDSIVRLLPGVLGDDQSSVEESFGVQPKSGLEYPHYTRPETYDGKDVPKVLLGGNHAVIADWRREQSTLRTKKRRPDLATT